MASQIPVPERVLIHCANCGGKPRNHEILIAHKEPWEDEEMQEHGASTYQVCRCLGCNAVHFRDESWSTMDIDWPSGQPALSVKVYPETAGNVRQALDATSYPDKVRHIYIETVKALNADALILAGGGLRAIVEAICIDQRVTGKNLLKRIDALMNQGLLARPQADLLHEERYIGNAALHELVRPSRPDIEDGLAIVEGLLNTIYLLPKRAQRLRAQRVPAKPFVGKAAAAAGKGAAVRHRRIKPKK